MPKQEQIEAVSYAVRGRVVARYLGQIALVLAGLTVVPGLVALYFGEVSAAFHYFGAVVLLSAFGSATSRLPAPTHIQENEALTITALVFLISPLFMVGPFMSTGLPLSDAFFEAVSAVTTTGLTTLSAVEEMPKSFLFARAWIQWYSGLGIVVLSLALTVGHHAGLRRLIEGEAIPGDSLLATTTRIHARRVASVYLAITAAGLLAMSTTPLDGFQAITHLLAAVSTGGFSSLDQSLGATGAGAYVLTAFSILGAISFPLLYVSYAHGLHRSWRDIELRGTLAALGITVVLIGAILLAGGMPWREALHHAFVLGTSAQTTSGFSSTSINTLDQGALLVLVLAMFIGGSTASTAGGIKIMRFLIVARVLTLAGLRTAIPAHAVITAKLGERRLASTEIERSFIIVLLFLITIVLSWLPFVLYGYDPLHALFEVVSATCTVGLSSGITATTLPDELRAVLCFDMIAGRVEILALFVALGRNTWIGKRRD